MFTSRIVKNDEILQGWRMGHGDHLKVRGGGVASNISVGYKAELEALAGSIVSGVSVSSDGEAALYGATAYDISATAGASVYFEDCSIDGLTINNCDYFLLQQSEVYGTISIQGVTSSLSNSYLNGSISVYNANINADAGTAFYGTLQLNYAAVSVYEVNVNELSLTSSELVSDSIYVEGNTTIDGSILRGTYQEECDHRVGSHCTNGTFEADGDVSIVNGASLSFEDAVIRGDVTVSRASMVTGNTVISGALNLNNYASAYASNCNITSVSVNNKSYLMISGGIRVQKLSIGTSSVVDLNKMVAYGVTVGSKSYLYASSAEIHTLYVGTKGSAVLYNGASATGAIVSDGGYLTVSSGGVYEGRFDSGSNIIVKAGGAMHHTYVSSGAVINGFNVAFTRDYVISGSRYTARYYMQNGNAGWGSEQSKTATDHYFNYDNDSKRGLVIVSAYVAGFDSAAIYSGQIADTIAVSYGGQAHVSSGAVMNSVGVMPNGSLYVSRGGKVSVARVESGGQMTVYKGGEMTSAQALSGGIINNSGTITSASIGAGAIANIGSTGAFNNTLVDEKAKLHVASGGALNGISATVDTNMTGVHFSGAAVNETGSLLGGQTASDITVNSGGTLIVFSNAEITNANANGGTIALAGKLSGGEVNNNGTINITSGGNAENVALNSGAVNVYSGGTAKDIDVNAGTLNIANGKASDIQINAGTVNVAPGGVAEDVVNKNGSFNVFSGGSFNSASLEGGETTIHSGALTGKVSMTGGLLNQKADAVVNGFAFAADYTHSGGLAYNGAFVKSDAQLNNGETASNTAVLSGGVMNVNSGASAANTTVSSGAQLNVFGSASGTIVSSTGKVVVTQNGSAADTKIENGGLLAVASGGVVSDTTVKTPGAVQILNGGTASDTTIYGPGTVDVYSGGKMVNGLVTSNGAIHVHSSGAVSNITAKQGSIDLSEDAVAEKTTLTSNGTLVVSSKATAADTVINSAGLMTVLDGGTAVRTTVSSKGNLIVSNGGIINGLTAEKDGNVNGLTVTENQSADRFLLSNAVVSCHSTAYLYNNQSAVNAAVYSSAILNVYSGGVVDGATVSHGGIRASGGVINSAVLQDYAMILARSGAVVNDTDLSHGELFVYDATANRTQIKTFGALYVNSGVVNDTTVANGYISGSKDSLINNTVIKGGTMITSGTVNNTTMVAGNISAIGNARIINTVLSGGNLLLAGKATHSGTLNIADGASVTVTAGATIDFTIAGRSVNDDYVVNNLALVSGAPSYSITVDPFEEIGVYKLAQGAAGFNKTVLIKDANRHMFYATTNAQAVYYEGLLYTVNENSGNLTLKVAEQERSAISINGVSQIIAWDAKHGTVGMVATTQSSGASWKGIWDWSGCCGTGHYCCVDKWKVVGTGRFQGTFSNSDGILLYNNENNTFAAWSNLESGDYGYISLCHVEANFSVKYVGNFNRNSYDDIIIYDENGNFGIVTDGTTYHDIWHVDDPSANNIKLIGAGYFGNPNGTESLLVQNTADNTYYFWHNNDTTFATWAWSQDNTIAGKAEDGWEVVAIGDFQGDNLDDIIVMNDNGEMFAWENGNSQNRRWVGKIDADGWEVAAVGDYNGDGKEDLLLRELLSGWGGLGYWGGANADNWVDLNARVENNNVSNFAIIA